MITDGKKWHYLAVINLSALFKEKWSNGKGGLNCLNCFNSYTTENKLKKHEEICNNYDSNHIEMPKQTEKNIKIHLWRKFVKSTICNLSWFRMFIKKRTILSKYLRKIFTEKKAIRQPSGWAMFTSCSFDEKENKKELLQWKRLYWKIMWKVKNTCN